MVDTKRLWTAVLIVAADDLIGDHPPHVRRFARLWFESSNRKPCSFIWLCESIDLDPSYVRKRVFQMAEASRPVSSPERARVNDHILSARGGYRDFPPRHSAQHVGFSEFDEVDGTGSPIDNVSAFGLILSSLRIY